VAEALVIDGPRHLAGIQCALRLWLEARGERGEDPARAAELSAGRRARDELRALAAGLLPGAQRDVLLRWGGFEARADFLVRDGDGRTGLRQVRAALRPSEAHLDELAFAVAVARASGLELGSVGVLHLAADFTRGAGACDPGALLRHSDVTRDVHFLARDLERRLGEQRRTAEAAEPPRVEPSPHCRRPSACPFWLRCTSGRRSDWIGYLPALRIETHAALQEQGVERAGDIPEDFPLSPAQENARESARRGAPYASPELAAALEPLLPEADFLDFEAIVPEIPLYPGTHPFEVIPFQWSAHLCDGGGPPRHAEFLAEGGGDPRRAFAESLLAAFGGRGRRIGVYSGFESDVLAQQARVFPDLAEPLDRMRARLYDLLPVMRRTLYHPAFLGSFSLKRIVPVLSPGAGWSDLRGVADGGAAARGWHALARGELSPEAGARLLAELRAYCARDSEALVTLVGALRDFAASTHSSP
jgi:hypothetical protein